LPFWGVILRSSHIERRIKATSIIIRVKKDNGKILKEISQKVISLKELGFAQKTKEEHNIFSRQN